MIGWYYLHENGDLIYKREIGGVTADIRDSSFARALWGFNPNDREDAWQILVEGLAGGANKSRVLELAMKWKCTDDDAKTYADRVGCVLSMDGDQWCATRKDFIDLQESAAGFGPTALEAMSALAKALGFLPSKMWGKSFKQLLH